MEFKSITEALKHWAEHTPDKICLIDANTERKCTYSELWRWSCAFAEQLEKVGIDSNGCTEYDKCGSRVVVRVDGLLETYTAMFGIMLAGGVYCPVEKNLQPDRMHEMIDLYDAEVYISSEEIESKAKYFNLHEIIDTSAQVSRDIASIDPDRIALIIFTTGTTGKSKGVMHSFKTHYDNAEAWNDPCIGLVKEDVFLRVQPFDRGGGAIHNLSTIIAGATTVHQHGIIFASEIERTVKRYSVTVLYLLPAMLNIFISTFGDRFSEAFSTLRILGIGGAAVSEKMKSFLARSLPHTRLYVRYAASELCKITLYEFGKLLNKPNCVGRPFADTEIIILDDNRRPMINQSDLGIVAIKTKSAFIGYWKSPDQTALALSDGLLITTDMGYIGDDGMLYIMSRRDDVIVSGGYKIAPYEVEDAVVQMTSIKECACIGIPDQIIGQAIKLFVTMESDVEFNAGQIYNHLKRHLENYKLPRSIVEIDEFPRVGDSPKIDRKELLKYV